MSAQKAQSKSYFVNHNDLAEQVNINVTVERGLPTFQMTGRDVDTIREARERVRSGLVNSGFEFPLRRITVEITPHTNRRYSSCYDLAVAAALLAACGTLDQSVLRFPIYGELGRDGSVRRSPTVAILGAIEARERQDRAIICPAADAGLVRTVRGGARALPVSHLRHLTSVPSSEEELTEIPREQESIVYGISRAQFRGVPAFMSDTQFDDLTGGEIDRVLVIDTSPTVPWDIAESVVSALGPPSKPLLTLLDEIRLNRVRWDGGEGNRFEVMRPVRRAMEPLSPGAMKKTVIYSSGGTVLCPSVDGETEVCRRALREGIDESNDVRLVAAVSSSLAERFLEGDAAAIQRVGQLAKELGVGPAGIAAPRMALAAV